MYCLCIVTHLTFHLPTVKACIPWTYRRVIGASVWTSLPQLYQPVSGVINKDCIQAECLYSSQIQHPNCEGTGASGSLHITNSPPSITVPNSFLPMGPVHEWTSMNNCCHPLRLNDSCSHCQPDGAHLGLVLSHSNSWWHKYVNKILIFYYFSPNSWSILTCVSEDSVWILLLMHQLTFGLRDTMQTFVQISTNLN